MIISRERMVVGYQESGRASRLTKCLIVGRPCGQFQGCSISLMWLTSFLIWCVFSAVPIMMDFLHARDAIIIRTRDGLRGQTNKLTIWFIYVSNIQNQRITLCHQKFTEMQSKLNPRRNHVL